MFLNFLQGVYKKPKFQLPRAKLTLDKFDFTVMFLLLHIVLRVFRWIYIHGLNISGFESSWWQKTASDAWNL